jgi:dienelactone hydrolase
VDVFALNRERAAAIASGRKPGSAVKNARLRSGFAPKTGPVPVRGYGSIARDGYRIEKLTYESEPGLVIPALAYVPEGGSARKPAVLVVDGGGKTASAALQERFVRAGRVVLAIDARGLGETRATLEGSRSDFTRFFGDYDSGMTAMLIGKTLAGMRAEDIVRGLDLLAARSDVDPARMTGYGKDAGAVPMLLAGALDRRLSAVALEGLLVSYEAAVNQRIHRQVFEQVIPGALIDFDLPDLVASLAPRPAWLINTTDPRGGRMREADVRSAQRAPAPSLRIRETRPGERSSELVDDLVRP